VVEETVGTPPAIVAAAKKAITATDLVKGSVSSDKPAAE
jgi:hypothetical protein